LTFTRLKYDAVIDTLLIVLLLRFTTIFMPFVLRWAN